ncbi:MAG: hypothetical protein LBK13_05125 [Spirochaetales bacterium]|jgi:hypothetical protein|nr:hypothetical protein [Spirochaetales bacterium]
MQILWAFRCNPLRRAASEFAKRKFAGQPGRMGEQQNCVRNFATSPLARAEVFPDSEQALSKVILKNAKISKGYVVPGIFLHFI